MLFEANPSVNASLPSPRLKSPLALQCFSRITPHFSSILLAYFTIFSSFFSAPGFFAVLFDLICKKSDPAAWKNVFLCIELSTLPDAPSDVLFSVAATLLCGGSRDVDNDGNRVTAAAVPSALFPLQLFCTFLLNR